MAGRWRNAGKGEGEQQASAVEIQKKAKRWAAGSEGMRSDSSLRSCESVTPGWASRQRRSAAASRSTWHGLHVSLDEDELEASTDRSFEDVRSSGRRP